VPLVLHNVAGPICHAAVLHLGVHIPNLYFIESVRAFYQTYFSVFVEGTPKAVDGHFAAPDGPGLGVSLRPEMLERPDLVRTVSEGEGLAKGRRAMGEHWSVEEIR
jgi:L-alanine-DL-glutamate epimerase-like enolase superfamily enzyme